ncbi:MAG: glutamate synthase large subunit [Chloroflexi bacterium]|nr:glutamate synthase large subunit [Chloroflexota bacterium]
MTRNFLYTPSGKRSSLPFPALYDPRLEHDACGVGFVASINGDRSHDIVEKAILSVVNVTHRGAVAADGKSGDGAGLLSQIPEKLFARELERLGLVRPEGWRLGVGMVFLPQDRHRKDASIAALESAVERAGLRVLGWRQVPLNAAALGERARATMPDIAQLLVAAPPTLPEDEVERRLYLSRKEAEDEARSESIEDFYVASFSCRTIVYKGLFVAPQLAEFYPDLHDHEFEAAIVVFHQRYSTNTFPTWFLAQPFRLLAHNGEINTLWGNRNWMRAREGNLESEIWGDRVEGLKPVVDEAGSDSAQLDNVLELLVQSGRTPGHAMMMLVPEAWENMPAMDEDVRAFYEYHALLMEPWDGPAALVFTDGITAGACLDRNGLRPARYKVTDDGLVVVASEVGVVDLDDQHVVEKGRLAPGEMLLVDTARRALYRNGDVKREISTQNPYSYWLKRKLLRLETSGFTIAVNGSVQAKHDLLTAQKAFGYTNEDLMIVLQPMGAEGHDAVWSMGDDTPLTVLSGETRPFYSFFKQRFAQVTNPPIDPLREGLVMSLGTYAGPRKSVLEETEEHAAVIELPSPVLMEGALERLKRLPEPHLKAHVLRCHFPAGSGSGGLEPAVRQLCEDAAQAVADGAGLLILSDRGVDENLAPIPMLLATSAVHQHLIRTGIRTRCDLIIEAGDVFDIHHFACLLGYGASAIDPYLALESVRSFAGQRGMEDLDPQQVLDNFRAAVEAGLLKIMSKMGISTLSAYRGAQIFEAIGIDQDVVETYFYGTPSRIAGVGLEDIADDVLKKHAEAFSEVSGPTGKRGLRDVGYVRYRGHGEYHGFNPLSVRAMHKATTTGDYDAYREYVALTQKHAPAEIRDLLNFCQRSAVPLDEVEPVEAIVRRFYTSAMSLGALSPEAVQTLALAMNQLGAKSNSGEGGEDPDWYGQTRAGVATHNRIKQVASARFGVTSWYLSQAEELEIKIAQGSKPGEGGQLPSHKVNSYIARLRHAIPGIPLISPPPHHDIYSIEDLAQLIYDLKQANPRAYVGVKLVSEAGVGTIAAGVAKAYADYVLISGDSGGTGSSPLSSIKNAGCPWELGLAETQQVLVLNDLRGRVRLRTDGGLKTGRDVVIAAMLGAEEFGFGTSSVVALGCDMARQCHLNTCPTGVATQRADLRAKFTGTPEMVINYFTFLAREMREILASLGARSLDEMIGRSDLLEQVCELPGRGSQLKLDAILTPPDPTFSLPYKQVQDRNSPPTRDRLHDQLVEDARPAFEEGKRVSLSYPITNSNRAVGTRIAYEISKRHGGDGLGDGTLVMRFAGSAGQSFGAFLTRGMRLVLEGEANDYVGKGMGGGEIVIVPSQSAKFAASENIIMGNTVLYGATAGRLFAAGRAGERFAVRNSGATAVVEGAGDHCCEYMTGGTVVVLGPVGRNFAAGMSAGTAFVLDENGSFPDRVNPGLVEIERVRPDDASVLRSLIEEHVAVTSSVRGRDILKHWGKYLPRFWRVVPDPPTVQTQTPEMASVDSGTDAPAPR